MQPKYFMKNLNTVKYISESSSEFLGANDWMILLGSWKIFVILKKAKWLGIQSSSLKIMALKHFFKFRG